MEARKPPNETERDAGRSQRDAVQSVQDPSIGGWNTPRAPWDTPRAPQLSAKPPYIIGEAGMHAMRAIGRVLRPCKPASSASPRNPAAAHLGACGRSPSLFADPPAIPLCLEVADANKRACYSTRCVCMCMRRDLTADVWGRSRAVE